MDADHMSSHSKSRPGFPRGLYPWTVAGLDSFVARDPVNLLLADSGLSETSRVLNAIGLAHVGWLERLAEPQWFRHTATSGQPAGLSLATGRAVWPPGQRLHARLFSPGPGSADPIIGIYTAMTGHLDRYSLDVLGCGSTLEVASSFTVPREQIAQRLAGAGHAVTTIRTRNRGSVRQCDGTRVVVDGRVAVIR